MKHALTIFRAERGLSVKELAALAGTSRQTIYRIENWEQVPSLGLVGKLVRVSDGAVTANDFLAPQDAA